MNLNEAQMHSNYIDETFHNLSLIVTPMALQQQSSTVSMEFYQGVIFKHILGMLVLVVGRTMIL